MASTADQLVAPVATATDALDLLLAGNERFVAGRPQRPHQDADRRQAVAAGQHPYAAILACADSRVPPEVAFDQGLGDLFVIRTAGQVVDRAVMGTLQYGVLELGVPLVLVLGHSRCGAVTASIAAAAGAGTPTDTDIDTLVAAIAPSAATATPTDPDPVATVVLANIARIVDHLRSAPVLDAALSAHRLKIQGAIYDLDSGRVDLV
jgi:carbonic anhydrase